MPFNFPPACVEARPYISDAAIACVLRDTLTGSRVICNPPVLNTDLDILLRVRGRKTFENALRKDGYVLSKDNLSTATPRDQYHNPGNRFGTARKNEINLIYTDNEVFYYKFVRATELAKQFNLREKNDRVTLFRAILYGE